MLLKKIFYFSFATTALAIGGPVAAYLTKPNSPVTVSQESTHPATPSTKGDSNDKD